MLFTFLLVVQAIVAAAMIGVILMQKSEGGGLGMGGSPSGLLSARGAADFLTRTTTILACLFVGLCIVLAALASTQGTSGELDTSLTKSATPAPVTGGVSGAAAPSATVVPVTGAPASNDPLAAGAAAVGAAAATPATKADEAQGVPIEQ